MEHVIARYRHQWELEKEISNQLKTLEEKTIQLKESNLGIFRILYTISEYHDTDSTNRSHRIKEYTHVLLKYVSQNYPEYGLEDRQMEKIEYASSLLDIGKLALPENILQKSSKLTMEELDLVKQHTVKGCEIIDKMAYLEDKEFLRYCYEICRYHHERYDGSGYPDRLQGEEIPISAQVVSVVCTYDFLLSSSSYKSSVTPNKAFHMVVDGECGSFSPKLLRCFTLAKKEIEEITDYMNLQKIQK
jgi:putative two-component system response regulator